ncbi:MULTISPECIES: hypothetical protein [Streptomyces]|uniref:hypothetical protein n=1 Tax=Streptomyces TaxID=1883 RepID=UPI000F554A94|nr:MULTISPECIES: hypothetical protein [Streptomyces]MBP0932408.1 hypothetical protein [Streptomyces sp. KCTC 0041BP]RPK29287.1 hypothetical protein EES37_34825 [Streptomyces sp. ADI91-18]
MASTMEREETKVKGLFERLEKLEEVAEDIESREPGSAASLRGVVQEALEEAEPVRVRVAASLLEFSDRTVRTWIDEGLLTVRGEHPLRLDPVRLHQVLHLVRDLRGAGRKRDLLDAVWYRLQDSALLDRSDLQASLDEMRKGMLRPALSKAEQDAAEVN